MGGFERVFAAHEPRLQDGLNHDSDLLKANHIQINMAAVRRCAISPLPNLRQIG
jgi:hypothetical protein